MEVQLKQAYINLREMIKNNNISVSKLYDNFQEIAYNVVSNINEIDNDEMDIVKPIQDYIRSCRIMVSDSIKNDITDYEAFRKSNFGKAKLVKSDGIAVDTLYKELSENNPGYFDENIINPTEQLEAIIDFINIKPTRQKNCTSNSFISSCSFFIIYKQIHP